MAVETTCRTALHYAAERDDLAAVRLLLEHGATKLGATDRWGATPALYLCRRGPSGDAAKDDERLQILRMLLASPADAALEHRAPTTEPTPKLLRGHTALTAAAAAGNDEVMMVLLDGGAQLGVEESWPPAAIAALRRYRAGAGAGAPPPAA
eukprot:COSAG01_NODE_22572_length_850_cov_1.163782_1_plen_151_part_01